MKVAQFLCEYAMVFSVIEVNFNQPCDEFTLAVELNPSAMGLPSISKTAKQGCDGLPDF